MLRYNWIATWEEWGSEMMEQFEDHLDWMGNTCREVA